MTLVLRRAIGAAVIPAALVVAGCTEREEPEVPEVPDETSTETDAAETTEPTPDESDVSVPFECSELFTAGRVVQIVQASLDGETRRIYNDDFLESSGRTGRLTCMYGVPTADETASPSPSPEEDPQPAVEIAVSSYVDEETAAGRIDTTLGATSRDVEPQTIGGREGYLLAGDDEVTFIVAEGVRTYVITLMRDLVPEDAEVVVILELAGELLDVEDSPPTEDAADDADDGDDGDEGDPDDDGDEGDADDGDGGDGDADDS
ncbi:hypothetical protein EF847_09465 [Actinobacteria bacterium YIM 96077]|uniref:Uncharacterized protein n=1 Tax=Phytoactinopolyspora halophila TaxID=1981511 RepID=A0A329QAQ0_9ACTN|nr:hypothetical protein [Phytoactinopolyspora halophila]AYY12897.1 hypothetical protein EF847_09465 [Actinobacteria bacterium YIM 96077]RAW09307.1 hypothetical protein DPM12_21885 [Phytoactinopolyspora halophila]